MIVARTRYGNPIEIHLQYRGLNERNLLLKIFDLPEENYDAWAVFAALAIRSARKKFEKEWQLSFELATKFYTKLFPNSMELETLDEQLGIGNSIERLRYARSLFLAEFLD